jgi:hypothetical protein
MTTAGPGASGGRRGAAVCRVLLAVASIASLCAAQGSTASEPVRETRSVPEVRRVVLRGVADLILHQGARPALEVEAARHLLPRMTSQVRDGTLYLETSGFVLSRRPLRFHLTLPHVESLTTEGSGETQASRLTATDFSVVAAGSGAIRIASLEARQLRAKIEGSAEIEIGGGRVEEQRVAVEGSGDYRAGALACDHAVVSIAGSGNARVTARNKVSANIYGSGEVDVQGNPRIEQSISGAGAVTRLGR